MSSLGNADPEIVRGCGDYGYVLADVPHFSDYLPHLPTYTNPLHNALPSLPLDECFVNEDDTITQKAIQHKNGKRGTHFRRAGPRLNVYFEPDEVRACIVTCGGLCPGLNTVIREIVSSLNSMYGVQQVLGIQGGYTGFYSRNTITLTPKIVNNIHKQGGTILGTSSARCVTSKVVEGIQDRGINHVYIIGGYSTLKGASAIYEEIRKRNLKVSVAVIPKNIDNDIPVIDKSFGFDTAVEEAQRAINAAHVEAESVENCIGLVKLMGRHSGFIALHASLANQDVNCCLIPETPFNLEGPGGLFEYIHKCLKKDGHMVIVVAEGASPVSGQVNQRDVGLWLGQQIKTYFSNLKKMDITLKYIDPTYMIRAIPSNASDNVYCTLLAQNAVHGAMAGYTGFTTGLVNMRNCYIPFRHMTESQNHVVITDRMWARLLSSTNQPSFDLHSEDGATSNNEENN